MNIGNLNNKLMDRFFRRVDGVVWDLMTGKVGVRTSDGIITLEGTGDDAQVTINMFDQFGLEVPAFAQSTPAASVAVGDLIYGDRKALGWVVSVNVKPSTVTESADATPVSSVKSFTLMTPDGTRKSWTPPKVSMLGFDSGVMVLRSLMNMLPGGNAGLGQMQNMLMPMLMMGGDSVDLNSIMPLMLFQATNSNGDTGGMGNMMQMMLMMQLMGKGGLKGSNFFDRNK